MNTMDEAELNDLLNRFVGDLGATMSAGNVVLGDRLGLYRALADHRPLAAGELAERSGTAERYVREWLAGQAAGGYVSFDPASRTYWLSAAQAVAFADPDGLALPGAFELAVTCIAEENKIRSAFRTREGVAWGDHDPGVFTGCERFYRPGYVANLVSAWIPAIDGLASRLETGTAVADVGCGLGTSTMLVARTYPETTVTGFDSHSESILLARKAAAAAGLADRVDFRTVSAQDFPATGTASSRPSTACMTWVTRSVPPGTFATCSRTTVCG